ncbi:class I SAM-dependent DNA methyltransferase [Brevibacillus daliensis]|uniref:class I SAM-dependent DNA methyltransferase n=1 Tax=Brevibacillus daliensis TaxID=2892995 RepID=UPI001E3EB4C9|nr:class I SAM-dependent methyltransferase [Brevibacillus daliensis]
MNMYQWADYYDLTQRGLHGDLQFYKEYAMRTKGEVLDLACGTGRIGIPLAKEGIPVTGLDLSTDMLQRAEEKAVTEGVSEQITFIQGDMRSFQIDKKFSLIMIPFRSFLHLLYIQDQMKALKKIREHLAPNGKLVFNVFVPVISHLYEESENLKLRSITPLENGEQVAMYDFTRYDHYQQLADVTRTYERLDTSGKMIERITGRFTLRYIFPSELHHLLRLNGFKVVERFGNFQKASFGPDSKELILVAEAL